MDHMQWGHESVKQSNFNGFTASQNDWVWKGPMEDSEEYEEMLSLLPWRRVGKAEDAETICKSIPF